MSYAVVLLHLSILQSIAFVIKTSLEYLPFFFHFSYKSPRAGSLLGKQDRKQRRRLQRELQKSNSV